GRTPIACAASRGHAHVVRLLLEDERVLPNLIDGEGRSTPMHSAASAGHPDIVQDLLDSGLTPNYLDKEGRTPLFWAVRHFHQDMLWTLLTHPDVNLSRSDSRTPLHAAVVAKHEPILKLLLERQSITPNPVDELGETPPPNLAATVGSVPLIQQLLAHKDTDVNPRNMNSETPFYTAIMRYLEEAVPHLLQDKRLDINLPARQSSWPL
ncbi:ankyrin, partial [Choiromyces venosus 120613-1]